MAFIQYEEHDQVGLLTIDRPQALNALNTELLKELEQVLDQVNLENTRCLVITGAGDKSFLPGTGNNKTAGVFQVNLIQNLFKLF